jgi:DNA-binding transcriptional MerR regulator
MLKIGEFAQACRVTVRTLRYYDQIGLLKPSHVDPWTGYRYYARDQAARLHRITTLKDLGLSLEQIGPLLGNDLAPAEIRGMLKLKEAELADQVQELQTQLSRVRTWLGEVEKEKKMTEDECTRVVLIDAVEAFQRVEREIKYWQPRSFVQVRVVCMQAAGWKDADYDTIMTISGFGPSFAYHAKKFWPQYLAPSGCDERIARATGFGWEWQRYETVEDYWQALKETIDAGNPIHAPYYEEVVLVGYQDADGQDERKARPLVPHGVGAEPDAWWTWKEFEEWFDKWSHKVLGRHTKRTETIPPRESAIEALETIVQMATDDPRAQNPDLDGVKWGLEGLQAYADDVGDMSRSGKPNAYFYDGWLGCHAIYPQISGRASAAVYLERLGRSSIFPGAINEHILAAADAYGAARAAWGDYEKHLGNEEMAEASDSWLIEEHRLAGAAAIRQAIEYERAAINEVQQGLAAI